VSRSSEREKLSGRIATRILVIRGHKALIDADLAALYGVPTRVLNQAVKRNRERFPPDFIFQLTSAERDEVITNCDHLANLKYSRALPYAFTEHGALMASTVLNSQTAVDVSLYVVRAFVRLRTAAVSHDAILRRLDGLEAKYDRQFAVVFDAIRELMRPPEPPKRRRIGFVQQD